METATVDLHVDTVRRGYFGVWTGLAGIFSMSWKKEMVRAEVKVVVGACDVYKLFPNCEGDRTFPNSVYALLSDSWGNNTVHYLNRLIN